MILARGVGRTPVKAAAVVAEILERESVKCLIGYPSTTSSRRRRGRHPHDHRAQERTACTVRRLEPGDLRRAASASSPASTAPGRRTRSGAWPRLTATRCRWSCCPAASRGGTQRRPTSARSSTTSTSRWAEQAVLPERWPTPSPGLHQVQNGRRGRAGRGARRCLACRGAGRLDYTPAPRLEWLPAARRGRGRGSAGRGRASRDLRGPGRALREGLEAAAGAGRAAGGPGDHQPGGQERFPRTIRCRWAPAAASISKQLHHFLNHADLIFGIGCSFSTTNYGVAMPKGKRIVHATLDPADINKDVPAALALVGDAGLTLEALVARSGTACRAAPEAGRRR